jgi:hypothetical protein
MADEEKRDPKRYVVTRGDAIVGGVYLWDPTKDPDWEPPVQGTLELEEDYIRRTRGE